MPFCFLALWSNSSKPTVSKQLFQNQCKLLFFSIFFQSNIKASSFRKFCLGFGKLMRDSWSAKQKRKFWLFSQPNLLKKISLNSRVFSNVHMNVKFCNHFVIRWFQFLTSQWKRSRLRWQSNAPAAGWPKNQYLVRRTGSRVRGIVANGRRLRNLQSYPFLHLTSSVKPGWCSWV